MKKKNINPICYLCGLPIADTISDDHIPPSQFFPSYLRKILSPNLITLPTHTQCNKSYQKDEDYFLASFYPATEKSIIHPYITDDIQRKLNRKESKLFLNLILSEFEERPSGLYLPHNLVRKEIDTKRAIRVAWKITRGLHFYHFKEYLEENIEKRIGFYQTANELPSPAYNFLINSDLFGEYQDVFYYRLSCGCFINPRVCFHIYLLVLWKSILILTIIKRPC